ncbi:MAG: MBL fold metallo-hydrolase [Hyphomonadaceae bacterium]
MNRWLIGLGVVIAALGVLFWWEVLDGAAPARADNAFDVDAYRALIAGDRPETLPTGVRVAIAGRSEAPAFAAEAGAFDGQRTFAYVAFQVLAPDGGLIVDAAADEDSLARMSGGKGRFDPQAYGQILAAIETTPRVMVTHEHWDHVMAIARHPHPGVIAPNLALTQLQIEGMREHAVNGQLAPEIAGAAPLSLAGPTRIAPGIVAAPAPGHSPGSIVVFVATANRDYLFIGDIAWQMSAILHARGRPRFISLLMPAVDPDRPAVLRQVRALHDLADADPRLVILPSHDEAYLRDLIADGVLGEGIAAPAP